MSKLAGEHYCRTFFDLYGFETVILRYFNVFGPRQDPYSQYSAVIPKFIDILLNGGRPVVNGDGSQTRDFTYVANVVQANLRLHGAGGAGAGVQHRGRASDFALELLAALEELTVRRRTPSSIRPESGMFRIRSRISRLPMQCSTMSRMWRSSRAWP